MKVSKYTTDIEINSELCMLYNTFSRKYYVYKKTCKEELWKFMEQINKGVYTQEELELFKELLAKQIIVQDSLNEMQKLEVLENSEKYQEKVYKIVIFATNACNFRCSYCEQEHVTKILSEQTVKRILEHIDKKAKKFAQIEIDWFGGEPLLEYARIKFFLEKARDICKKNNCEMVSTITTNGYLLTDEMLEKLWKLNVHAMQITLDGNKSTHDKRRMLSNGEGTFRKILQNVNRALQSGMNITIRINVDEENVDNIGEVLEGISPEYRSRAYISISNIFQSQNKKSVYSLMKTAIKMGFSGHSRKNSYVHCHACLKNSSVIDTDGSVLLCPYAKTKGERIGYLNERGDICIEEIGDYYKLRCLTARDNPECRECVELPYCIGSCKYGRMQSNITCMGNAGDGMTLRERALLDYYYDLYKNKNHV